MKQAAVAHAGMEEELPSRRKAVIGIALWLVLTGAFRVMTMGAVLPSSLLAVRRRNRRAAVVA